MGPRGKGDVAQMIRAHLAAGQIGLDVGAALGEMTKVMLERVGPSGHVYAIEPDATKGERFWQTVGPVANVTLTVSGAGEASGTMPLHRATSTAASRWHGDGQPPTMTTPLARLDDLVPQAVDLVKIDTQGSEAHILDGAPRLLDTCPVWILELWPWGLGTAKRTPLEVITTLREHGLTPRWPKGEPITDDDLAAWIADTHRLENSHCNILATR